MRRLLLWLLRGVFRLFHSFKTQRLFLLLFLSVSLSPSPIYLVAKPNPVSISPLPIFVRPPRLMINIGFCGKPYSMKVRIFLARKTDSWESRARSRRGTIDRFLPLFSFNFCLLFLPARSHSHVLAQRENDGEVSRPGAKAKSYDLQHLIEEPKFYRWVFISRFSLNPTQFDPFNLQKTLILCKSITLTQFSCMCLTVARSRLLIRHCRTSQQL